MDQQAWYDKHGLSPDAEGWFDGVPECKKLPISEEQWASNLLANAKSPIPCMKSAAYNPRTMVMVCGGPTAAQFLDDIRAKARSKEYDVFCSNKTGEWLLENGIVPQFHVCIDPKPEKVNDFRLTHPDTTCLISISCDPSVFEYLENKDGVTARKFYAVSTTNGVDAEQLKLYLGGDTLAICGGTMMGVRAITLADGLGYRRLEYYGFDASIENSDHQYSYDKTHNEAILDVEAEDGRVFVSTPLFADQVRQMMLWRGVVPHVETIFYGDSFMSHMMRLYEEKNRPKTDAMITDEYLEMQKHMHEKGNYGISGHKHAHSIFCLAEQLRSRQDSVSILDYGCGRSTLRKSFDKLGDIPGVEWQEYDPAIKGKDVPPTSADIVVCTDVMEHVEYDCISNVLDDIQRLTKKVAFFWISTVPAVKKLPNGENAHISILPPDYWYGQINRRFVIAESRVYDGAVAIVGQSLEAVK